MGAGAREANRRAVEAENKVKAAAEKAAADKAAADKAAADKAERDRIAAIVREVQGTK